MCIIELVSINILSTLQKFHACLRAQGELGTIKRLLKHNEIVSQLDRCEAELKAGLQIFNVCLQCGDDTEADSCLERWNPELELQRVLPS
jgi:hypothetical protein